MANDYQKIRIILRSFDHRLIDKSIKNIIEAVKELGAKIIGPVPFPTKIKRYTILRSPHVNKKSREQFEIRTHKRLIDIVFEPSNDTIRKLNDLKLPGGVDIELKLPD